MKKHKKVIDFDEIVIKPKVLILGSLIVLAVFLLLAIFLAYGTKTSAGIRLKGVFAKVIPAPAAIINYRHVVLSSELEKNLASVQQFYATQDLSQTGLRVDFSTPDGQKRLEIKKKDLLQKMVEDKAIEILAGERGSNITTSQVDQVVNKKLQEFGTLDKVKQDLLISYGWTIEDFKKEVVLPSVYKDALTAYFNEHDSNAAQAKDLINKAKAELVSGKDFAQVANDYSNGSSKANGGQLGWVKKSQLLPELQGALFGGSKFQNDSVIESSIGFHLLEVENQKKENGEDMLQLRQIFVAKTSFADWLALQMKKMSIILPSSEFVWNKNDGLVEFRDKSLNEFEKKARADAQGDASIIF